MRNKSLMVLAVSALTCALLLPPPVAAQQETTTLLAPVYPLTLSVLACLSLVSCCLPSLRAAEKRRPNIVLIMADDK